VVLWLLPGFSTARADARSTVRPSAGCQSDWIEHGRRLEKTIEVDGLTRRYILDVPDGVRPRTSVPLLFDFHGFGHSGPGVWQVSKFRNLAEKEKFVTVYPDGLPVQLRLLGTVYERPGWQMTTAGNRDLAFVRVLLDDLEKHYCIDESRVFSTGFSNGAFFSSLLGCVMADRFAAVAPVSGGPLNIDCRPSRGVPILIQHGRQDELISIDRAHASRDQWVAADGCKKTTKGECERHSECRDNAVVIYCEEDFAHRWPPQATERIWKFFRGLGGSGSAVEPNPGP
jgi:polyhydroxybutyrate depolymerase